MTVIFVSVLAQSKLAGRSLFQTICSNMIIVVLIYIYKVMVLTSNADWFIALGSVYHLPFGVSTAYKWL